MKRYFFYTVIITFIITLQHWESFSQDTVSIKKNVVKGMIFLFPFPLNVVVAPSLGYERYLSVSSSIEIVGNYLYISDEMGNKTNIYSIMPGYNYYFPKKREKGPSFRVGGYLNYKKYIENDWGNRWMMIGAGLLGGVRINISKRHICFIDLAFGASLNRKFIRDEYFIEDNVNIWVHNFRPVIQFARRF